MNRSIYTITISMVLGAVKYFKLGIPFVFTFVQFELMDFFGYQYSKTPLYDHPEIKTTLLLRPSF